MLRGAFRKVPAISVLAALIAFGASDCVRVPPADPNASGPNIDKIVRRVKCDLVSAVGSFLEDEKYTWLQTWTAQASLTFIVNDASTLTPGASFIQPLTTETLPLRVTNAARSWNLGVGAGFNTTASRNETVTFSMSLREIKNEHRSDQGSDFCNYPDLTDLHSELGLREWINSALSPAGNNEHQFQYLTPGHHKTSKTSAGPSGAGGTSSSSSSSSSLLTTMISISKEISPFLKSLDELRKSALPPEHETTVVTINKTGAPIETRTPDPIGALQDDIKNKLKEITAREIDDPTTPTTTSLTSIAPSQGSSIGGTYVMITGANFDHRGSVTIGGATATRVQSPNDSTICAITPPHTASTSPVDVTVNTNNDYKDIEGAATKFAAFTYGDNLITITPRSGSILGNDPVTIQGADFTGATAVTIGGQPATIININTSVKPNTITATTSATKNPGVADVVVTITAPPPTTTSSTTITTSIPPAPPTSETTTTTTTTTIAPPPSATTTTETTTPPTPPKTVTTVTTPAPATTSSSSNDKTGPGLFTYFDPVAGAPPDCPAQASNKKRVIAYVDESLGRKIYATLFELRELIQLIEDSLKQATTPEQKKKLNAALQTAKALEDSLLGLQLDPPLDAIGHQVQFIIVFNASVSPSWTLLHFKGPTPGSGSGASATGTLTHTLNIAMGPPSSPDVANTLGALQLGTAIGNSIGTGALSITPP